MPVPAVPDADASSEQGSPKEDWPQQTHSFIQQQLGSMTLTIAEPAPSKAEKSVRKRSWAALCQQVQPSIISCSTAAAVSCATTSYHAQCAEPPVLGQVTASYVATFCGGGGGGGAGRAACGERSSSSSLARACPAVHASNACLLDEPVITAATTAWDRPTALFCAPEELQQLYLEVPDDVQEEGAWEAAVTRVSMVCCTGV